MALRFRTSKYRHATGAARRRDLWYGDVPAMTSTLDGDMIRASGEYVAFMWESGGGAGNVGVIPIDRVGKVGRQLATCVGHTSAVTDLDFHPFHDGTLATSSADSTVKIWSLDAEAVKANQSLSAATTLNGHGSSVLSVHFHPTANNLLASTSADKTVKLWDIAAGAEKQTLSGHNDAIQHASWSFDGQFIVTTCKDKTIRLFDPRANGAVRTAPGHAGVKASRVVWLGDSNRFLTTGFSQMRDRQFSIWDASDLSKSVLTHNLDSSTGILMPFYDSDTNMLFIGGKGDGNIRCYEISQEKPHFYDITVFASNDTQRGMCLLPKRGLDVMSCEVNRVLKLSGNNIIPVSFTVPRKTTREFQEDLFPNTRGNVASIDVEQWFSGRNDAPSLISLKPSDAPAAISQSAPTSAPNSNPTSPTVAAGSISATTSPTPATASVHDAVVPRPTSSRLSGVASEPVGRASLSLSNAEDTARRIGAQLVRQSKYRHVSGKAFKKDLCYDFVKPATYETTNAIKANKTFLAMPWAGTGGQLAVIPLTQIGRIPTEQPVIMGHSASIVDFDFNPFVDNMVATGSEDCHVKVWSVPEKGLDSVLSAPLVDLSGHEKRITTINFHPTASNVLASGSGDYTLRFWDIEKQSQVSSLSCHGEILQSVSFNYDGSKIATACKDQIMRILDPRSESSLIAFNGNPSSKGGRVAWTGENHVVATGFSRTSERQILLYDIRSTSGAVSTISVDSGSGLLVPHYDVGTGVLTVAGKGDGNIRFYEVTGEAPFIHYLTDYKSPTPQHGVAFMPKTSCDVRSCEFLRIIKLTKSLAEPIQFTVPRTRTEFFQDDIYPPTAAAEAVLDADSWFSGSNAAPKLVSLKPEGMIPLSEAPAEEKRVAKYSRDTIDLSKRSTGALDFLDTISAKIQSLEVTGEQESESSDSDWD